MMQYYYTDLDIEQCKDKIFKNVDGNNIMGTIRGKVFYKKNKFYLLKTKKKFVNPWARVFYGRLAQKGTGTLIQGYFKIHTLSKMFLTF